MSGVAFYIWKTDLLVWYHHSSGVMIGIYLAMRYAKALGYDRK